MKKNNLWLNLMFVCCALLVACGSVFGTAYQAQTLCVKAAEDAVVMAPALFKTDGTYAVERKDLVKGAKYSFFGYNWRVVYRNDDENVVTFWMDAPMQDTYMFNNVTASGNMRDANNTWCNGYTSSQFYVCEGEGESATWHKVTTEESLIRKYLRSVAETMIDNGNYNYANKVVKGQVKGSNLAEAQAVAATTSIRYAQGSLTGIAVPGYDDNVTEEHKTMVLDYKLTDDRLWLPCEEEIKENGIWGLENTDRNWNITTYANAAWLRNPYLDTNTNPLYEGTHIGMLVGYSQDNEGYYSSQSMFGGVINKSFGVRPAIHLSLSNIEKDHDNGNGNNSGWFTDDMMKVFFIVICILGVVGVVLVVTAVVIKSRQRKREQQGN